MNPFVGIEALPSFSQGSNTMFQHTKSLLNIWVQQPAYKWSNLHQLFHSVFYARIQDILFLPPRVGLNWGREQVCVDLIF